MEGRQKWIITFYQSAHAIRRRGGGRWFPAACIGGEDDDYERDRTSDESLQLLIFGGGRPKLFQQLCYTH